MSEAILIYEGGYTRADVDTIQGPALLNFGTDWCGYCRSATVLLSQSLTDFPTVRHVGIEDGPGRRLGRSFMVKLWPTLIFLRDGKELSRLVRPTSVEAITSALRSIV
jgi:thioredoxin 1